MSLQTDEKVNFRSLDPPPKRFTRQPHQMLGDQQTNMTIMFDNFFDMNANNVIVMEYLQRGVLFNFIIKLDKSGRLAPN